MKESASWENGHYRILSEKKKTKQETHKASRLRNSFHFKHKKKFQP